MDFDEISISGYITAYTEPPHEGKALNQGDWHEYERNNHQKHAVTRMRSFYIDILFKVLFVLLSIPWLISVIFFSIFDTKCAVFEQASVVNCSQGIFVEHPRRWVFAWLVISILTSVLLIFIIALNEKKLNYQCDKLKNIRHKGSFGSLLILLVTSSIFNFIRIVASTNTTSLFINILLFVWLFVTAAVVCCLNYLPRVHWRKTGLPRYTPMWWKACLNKNSNFIIYWLSLVVHFIEIVCKLTALTFDAAQDVAPLIQNKFRKETGEYRAIVFAIGFSLAFHGRLLSFFWLKMFHGEKDLFDEPSDDLVDESLSEDQRGPRQGEQGEIELKEIVSNYITSV